MTPKSASKPADEAGAALHRTTRRRKVVHPHSAISRSVHTADAVAAVCHERLNSTHWARRPVSQNQIVTGRRRFARHANASRFPLVTGNGVVERRTGSIDRTKYAISRSVHTEA